MFDLQDIAAAADAAVETECSHLYKVPMFLCFTCSWFLLIKFCLLNWQQTLFDEDLMQLEVSQHLNETISLLLKAEQRQAELTKTLRDIKVKTKLSKILPCSEPCLEYENIRRRIKKSTYEIWYYFNAKPAKLRSKFNDRQWALINQLIYGIADYQRAIVVDMEQLQLLDTYTTWRKREMTQLSDIVQTDIHKQQNPADCKKSNKSFVQMEWHNGFGNQIDTLLDCLLRAHSYKQVLLLISTGWYEQQNSWENIFQPLSVTCSKLNYSKFFDGHFDDFPPALYNIVPKFLWKRIKRYHASPSCWWMSQYLQYLLRPQPEIRLLIADTLEHYGWKQPIVGVHVRRTDKVGAEAAQYELADYMFHVENYYLTQEMRGKNMTRRIFLATDDSNVLSEARANFSQYEIISNEQIARIASKLGRRSSIDGLMAVIRDIFLLSRCDYVVCTLSSGVCRMAFEIMQSQHTDAAERVKSLDYEFTIYDSRYWRAVVKHKARNAQEIDLQHGDIVYLMQNLWNGFSVGTNERTEKTGFFPSFKIDRFG